MEDKSNIQRKAFLLTGHCNWGKSTTLREPILGGKNRSVEINGNKVHKKTSSNADVMRGHDVKLDAIRKFIVNKYPYIILAFSCNQADNPTIVLKDLQANGYKIYFYVLEHCCFDQNRTVTTSEKNMMQPYGSVKVVPSYKIAPSKLASDFYNFLQQNIP